MCGIVGVVDKKYASIDIVKSMVKTLNHRGPDDNGIWQNNNREVVLGHTRLSIIELSKAGSQPMISGSGRYIVTFNGEIYNHLQLRKKELSLFSFKGSSDTETLLACFERFGVIESLKHINGMFAFGVWDKEKEILTLARDRTGEKPLFYCKNEDRLIFASELKAFHHLTKTINTESLNFFLALSYVPSPQTIFKGINKLQAGNYIQYGKNINSKQIAYWCVDERFQESRNNFAGISKKNICNILNNELINVLNNQSVADVPIGAFLSGGIDSSLIVSILQSISTEKIKTFTIGSDLTSFDESKYAKNVSNYLKTDHTELFISSEDILNTIPLLPEIYDEPFADSSQIPTFLVSKLARKHVKVVLTGDGADELFGGYNRYLFTKNIWNKVRYLPLPFKKGLSKIINKLPQDVVDSSYFAIKKILPRKYQVAYPYIKLFKFANLLSSQSLLDMYSRLISSWDGSPPTTSNKSNNFIFENLKSNLYEDDSSIIQSMMIYDFKTYLTDDILQKVDRASMSVSLETRCPFLDHNVINCALSIPMNMKIRGNKTKWILRELLSRYMPRELFERPKMGFSVPIDNWLQVKLREWAEELLSASSLNKHGLLNTKVIRKAWQSHINGDRNMQFPLWNVLMFQAWANKNKI